MRGSSGAGVPRSASRLMAAAPTAVRQSTLASWTRSASNALCAWVPLMNARPSFGASTNGFRPAASSDCRAGTGLDPQSTAPSPISAKRDIDSTARDRRWRPTLPAITAR